MTPHSLRTLLRVRLYTALYTALYTEQDGLDTSVSPQIRQALPAQSYGFPCLESRRSRLPQLVDLPLKRILIDRTIAYRSTIVLQQRTVTQTGVSIAIPSAQTAQSSVHNAVSPQTQPSTPTPAQTSTPREVVQQAQDWSERTQSQTCPTQAPRILQMLWPTTQWQSDGAGGILVRLTAEGWQMWLNDLMQGGAAEVPGMLDRSGFQPIRVSWPIQLAYARCCGLLRSAMREGYIGLSSEMAETWQWLTPEALSWSDTVIADPDSGLYQWLVTIVDYLDALEVGEIRSLDRLGKFMVRAFQVCDRIYAIANPTLPPRVRQVYLGLVWLMQQCLKWAAGGSLVEQL